MPPLKSPPPRQNWTIVIFGFLALSLAFSGRAALGLIMPVWQAEFDWSSSYISGVGASALFVMAMVAPFAGRLVDRRGPRFTLNLGMGLLGIGCALVAMMDSKLMFAIGFAGFCAIGFGIVADPCRCDSRDTIIFRQPRPRYGHGNVRRNGRSVPHRSANCRAPRVRKLALELWCLSVGQSCADPLYPPEHPSSRQV